MSTVKEIADAIGKLTPAEVKDLRSLLGDDFLHSDDEEVTPEILAAIEEAERDRREGNTEAFTSLEDLRAEFAAADAKN